MVIDSPGEPKFAIFCWSLLEFPQANFKANKPQESQSLPEFAKANCGKLQQTIANSSKLWHTLAYSSKLEISATVGPGEPKFAIVCQSLQEFAQANCGKLQQTPALPEFAGVCKLWQTPANNNNLQQTNPRRTDIVCWSLPEFAGVCSSKLWQTLTNSSKQQQTLTDSGKLKQTRDFRRTKVCYCLVEFARVCRSLLRQTVANSSKLWQTLANSSKYIWQNDLQVDILRLYLHSDDYTMS